jgi:ABC transporter with metal-binding/Fe-S-binding domain ATP-binding protein
MISKNKNACVLFSGGKDSTYSTLKAIEKGYNIKCLLVLTSSNLDSYMFQKIGIKTILENKNKFKFPIIEFETKGIKEEELIDLEKAMKFVKEKFEIKTIITGAVKSKYQYTRISKICENLNLSGFHPLWKCSELDYMNELISKKDMDIRIVKIASYPFTKELVGKQINEKILNQLIKYEKKVGTSLAGEGGEFESLVVKSNLLKENIEINFEELKIIEDGENLAYLKL